MLLLVFLATLWSNSLHADQAPPPDVSGWQQVQTLRLDVRLDDDRLIILGFSATYQDPADPASRVRVFYQHQPVVVMARQSVTDSFNATRDLTSFNRNREESALTETRKSATPFCFIAERDSAGTISGTIQAWLIRQDGTWTYSPSAGPDAPYRTAFSEPDFRHRTRLIPVGIAFHLDQTYHIVRVSQSDLPTLKAAQKLEAKRGK